MRIRKLLLAGACGAVWFFSQNALAETYEIKGVVTKWEPMVLFVQPGDQVTFSNMTGHDAATIDGMIPEGADSWQSKMGAEGFTVKLEQEGVYMYKCTPHVSLGMIGAIIVGDATPQNLAAVEAHKENKGMIGRSVRKMKKALQEKGLIE